MMQRHNSIQVQRPAAHFWGRTGTFQSPATSRNDQLQSDFEVRSKRALLILTLIGAPLLSAAFGGAARRLRRLFGPRGSAPGTFSHHRKIASFLCTNPGVGGLKCWLNFEQRPHIPRSHRSRLRRDSPHEMPISGDRRRQEEGIPSFMPSGRCRPPRCSPALPLQQTRCENRPSSW